MLTPSSESATPNQPSGCCASGWVSANAINSTAGTNSGNTAL